VLANPAETGSSASRADRDSFAPENQSVAYQISATHTGNVQAELRRPLGIQWSVDLRWGVGYPVAANGIVVVVAGGRLMALKAKTGERLWAQQSPSETWVGPAYDNGLIFVDPRETFNNDEGIVAFDERSGTLVWSAQTPQEWDFTSPPTAYDGTVYTAAAGDGGFVYAYDEQTGALKWRQSVENGEDSSPAVTSDGVYVSYSCPQTYDFDPQTGAQIWHYSGICEGGGGSTPVLYDRLLFVEAADSSKGRNALIFKAKTGKVAGAYTAYYPPAFADRRGYFVKDYGRTLEARSIPAMAVLWRVRPSRSVYAVPPLVVGHVVYEETETGVLLGYDRQNGKQQVDIDLGHGGARRGLSVALGYYDGELLVPNGTKLFALKGR
jgi:outer membrane protein assembly factor BamB